MAAARLCAALSIVPLLLLLPLLGASAQIDDAGLKFATTEDVGGSGGDAPTFQPLAATVYAKVVEPTLSSKHLEDLPGFTRSVVKKDHALITPESQVFSGVPGWTNTLAAYFVTPAIGAHFTMMIAHMAGNSSAAPPSPGVERFIFVVTGEVSFKYEGKTTVLQVDSYAYSPPDQSHEIHSAFGAAIVVIERKYTGAGRAGGEAPQFVVGANLQQPILPVAGEVFVLRKLLPQTEEYDFNIHIMDFQPGEYLNVKEVHYNQHGLLLLEGRGIYRLADNWYPVQAGDVIWMAPFVPQWYAALGRTKSRYLLYKDTNRDPLFY